MKTVILLFFIMLVLASVNVYAQGEIWGIIVDDNGKPVPGATVRTRNEKDSVVTDAKGRFLLPNAYPNKTVTVSKLSYTTREFLPGPLLYFEIVLSKRRSPLRFLKRR